MKSDKNWVSPLILNLIPEDVKKGVTWHLEREQKAARELLLRIISFELVAERLFILNSSNLIVTLNLKGGFLFSDLPDKRTLEKISNH